MSLVQHFLRDFFKLFYMFKKCIVAVSKKMSVMDQEYKGVPCTHLYVKILQKSRLFHTLVYAIGIAAFLSNLVTFFCHMHTSRYQFSKTDVEMTAHTALNLSD